MTRAEINLLRANLESKYRYLSKLGGYSSEGETIWHLTGDLLAITTHLIEQDKEIARLKRAPKKKKK